jgi:hypothetical protein
MFVTVVAIMCKLIVPGPMSADRDCAPQESRVEEIVTNSDLTPELTFIDCQIHGIANVAKWKSEHPLYHSDKWRIAQVKCAPGHYEIRGAV